MFNWLRRFSKIIYLILFVFSVALLIPFNNKSSVNLPTTQEQYNSQLAYLKTTDNVISYIDSIYSKNNPNPDFDTIAYINTVSEFIKERFHYGLSRYSLNENWIAVVLGKISWSHFSAIVDTKHLLKHNEGLCSQQTIVFLSILKERGIKFRTVGLGYEQGPGHYLCEVYYNGGWHLFDVTKEPNWQKISKSHESMNYYLQNKDTLYKVYESVMPEQLFYKVLEKVEYGEVSEMPAKKMKLFHSITKGLTYVFPILFFILFVYSGKNTHKEKLKN